MRGRDRRLLKMPDLLGRLRDHLGDGGPGLFDDVIGSGRD